MSATEEILKKAGELIASSSTRRLICGEYSDGTPRSIVDAINGEYKSPKEKRKEHNKKRRKASLASSWAYDDGKKKKKKKKNKKSSYKKSKGPLDKYISF